MGLGEEILASCRPSCREGCASGWGSPGLIVGEPEVLLFDEPTAGLDPTNSEARGRADRASCGEGVCDTAMVVTHDIDVAKTIADRVSILIHGRFAVSGPLQAVMDSPSADVQAFLAGDLRAP